MRMTLHSRHRTRRACWSAQLVGWMIALGTGPALGAATPTDWSGDGGVSAFYRYEAALPTQAGLPLRHESANVPASLPHAAQFERLLYTSGPDVSSGRHDPVSVSAAVYLPKGEMPAGGWPILAWLHGTIGVADVCAPSWAGDSADRQTYIDRWLAAGFAVVATDYRGLGTPGLHPYLLYRPEGQDALDSVRAALRQWPQHLSNRIVVAGQSQGGGAALGAAWLAPDYAPELKLLGTIATGPAIDIADADGAPQRPIPPFDEDGDAVGTAFETLTLLGTAPGADPSFEPAAWVSEAGLPVLKRATEACFHAVIDFAAERKLGVKAFYGRPIAPLNALVDQAGRLPNGKLRSPLFIGTGLDDQAVIPLRQYNVASAICHAGGTVEWHRYANQTHTGTVLASQADAIGFAQARLAGKPAVGARCEDLTPP